LVRGFNDGATHLADLASFLGELGPRIAYLSVPTRPPAEPDVEPPPEAVITQTFQLVRAQVAHVELLIGYEGNAFAATGALAEDLLSITAVHPMREDAVQAFVSKAGGDMSAVDSLIEQGLLARTSYDGSRFYIRRLQSGASR
jgi:wyosine [tRNA(Phe)-imidazoG37] synthetase (radical SAM superfamily)